ncbi:DUF5131 family protein [Mycolicibacterium fortuitum]|uniref:DUF5131 family protein n=1 Tax=Mycolicibacterium fortuitum TaxID=1766 RepID=UPI001CE0EE3C|nr:DUF5131 family protein [Mycolicibacterium fortuitum]MCA4726657.1 DUF5131 family protein [Mycolicibacterium fortuitum]
MNVDWLKDNNIGGSVSGLDDPIRWSDPRCVSVCAGADLFDEALDDQHIARVFAVMAAASHHRFEVSTTRPNRMRALVSSAVFRTLVDGIVSTWSASRSGVLPTVSWPLPNVYLGVEIATQREADTMVATLASTPAAARFVRVRSAGPIDLRLPAAVSAESDCPQGMAVLSW